MYLICRNFSVIAALLRASPTSTDILFRLLISGKTANGHILTGNKSILFKFLLVEYSSFVMPGVCRIYLPNKISWQGNLFSLPTFSHTIFGYAVQQIIHTTEVFRFPATLFHPFFLIWAIGVVVILLITKAEIHIVFFKNHLHRSRIGIRRKCDGKIMEQYT